jgi:hypothetical protein
MLGWRHLGERMVAQAKSTCPTSKDEDGKSGPHLKETLIAKFISGADARILIGSEKKGDVLGYLTQGTSDHFVAPKNAQALRWTSGGTVYFSRGHQVSGIPPNDFLIRAIRDVARKV